MFSGGQRPDDKTPFLKHEELKSIIVGHILLGGLISAVCGGLLAGLWCAIALHSKGRWDPPAAHRPALPTLSPRPLPTHGTLVHYTVRLVITARVPPVPADPTLQAIDAEHHIATGYKVHAAAFPTTPWYDRSAPRGRFSDQIGHHRRQNHLTIAPRLDYTMKLTSAAHVPPTPITQHPRPWLAIGNASFGR